MSRPLALFCLAALTVASIALWFDQAIRRGFRDLRIGCTTTCPCAVTP